MENLIEHHFMVMYKVGSLSSIGIRLDEKGYAFITFTLLNGDKGEVHTKRGIPKRYKLDTVMKELKELGINSIPVDLSALNIDNWAGATHLKDED